MTTATWLTSSCSVLTGVIVFGAGIPKTNIKVGTVVTNCPNPQTAFRVQPLSTDEQTTIVIGTLTQTQTLTRSAFTKGRKGKWHRQSPQCVERAQRMFDTNEKEKHHAIHVASHTTPIGATGMHHSNHRSH
jgi:hypothetical protein